MTEGLSGNALDPVAINCPLELLFGNRQPQSCAIQLIISSKQQKGLVTRLAASLLEDPTKICCIQQADIG